LTGLEVCRLIRSRSWGAKTVLIAVTGFGRFRDFETASEAGFDHHCTKPVTFIRVQEMLPSPSASHPI
jgi:CheY-like chemotaxis protein